MVSIRSVLESDALQFFNLRQRLYSETSYLLLEPGEDLSSVEEQHDRIVRTLRGNDEALFVAEFDGALIGFIGIRRGVRRRNRHLASIAMGVAQAHVGRGVGKGLLAAAEQWARDQRLRRLELTVMVHNDRAIRLYRRAGFSVEGTKRESLVVESRATDEHVMAKLLSYDDPSERSASANGSAG